jgi:phage terminase large subunit
MSEPIRIQYTSVFSRNLEAYQSREFRVIGNQGSARSSKTFSLAQLLGVFIPFSEPNTSISIVSPSLPHIKKGARRDFLRIMQENGIYEEDRFNRTDNIYTYPNGSYVEFFGAEDAGKVRGPGRKILYCNEANLMNYQTYTQLALRTEQQIFLDFNPADEFSWVYDVVDKPGNLLIASTYKDNPFLSKSQVAEIEGLKDGDQNLWRVFGLGLRGTSSETIYTHWKPCRDLPGRGERCYGQDFGFNVPSALVEIEFWEGAVYWKQRLYETKLTTGALIDRYREMGIERETEIFCDAAEPKTIQELCDAGYNALPADKAVFEGIRKCKSLPLYITEDSTDLIKEAKSYKWKKDKDDKTLDEPVKFNDHALDAGRYGTFTKLTQPAIGWDEEMF